MATDHEQIICVAFLSHSVYLDLFDSKLYVYKKYSLIKKVILK